MELEITSENENPLFKRKEVQLSLETQITPSKNEVIESLAEKFSTQAENISIKGIHGKFGSNDFTISANIYSTKEDKEKSERKSKKKGDASKPGENK